MLVLNAFFAASSSASAASSFLRVSEEAATDGRNGARPRRRPPGAAARGAVSSRSFVKVCPRRKFEPPIRSGRRGRSSKSRKHRLAQSCKRRKSRNQRTSTMIRFSSLSPPSPPSPPRRTLTLPRVKTLNRGCRPSERRGKGEMKCGDGRDEPRVNDVHEVYSPPHSGFGFSTKEGEEKA